MDKYLKRKNNDGEETEQKKIKKETCPHGPKCYRRNPHHFVEYDHPHLLELMEKSDASDIPNNLPQPKQVYEDQIAVLNTILKKDSKPQSNLKMDHSSGPGCSSSSSGSNKLPSKLSKKMDNKSEDPKVELNKNIESKPNTMLEKLTKAAPYNLFFTTICKAPETFIQENAITFTDLLCPSLGQLKCSLQINFMIDIDWLLKQYKARGLSSKPLTILYGDDWPDMVEFINKFCPNVTHKFVTMKDPFGCHHSKIGIYVYEDESLRVVVSTANLYYEDWNHYNQGLWLSPACKKLPDSSSDDEGESPTGFKAALLTYLKTYGFECLKPFMNYVKRADFSDIRVFLVYSVPGKHYPHSNGSHVHKVGYTLAKHCILPKKTTPESEGPLAWGVIAQSSSLGSMGSNPNQWLKGSILRSLASNTQSTMPKDSKATLSIIFPTVENVYTGYFGAESGGCLPYSKATNEKQPWLKDFLQQWKASKFARTRAMPHIKSYCRVSPCLTKLAYFLLTSANISKSAWGGPIGKDNGVYVRSYEAGVLFLPKLFDEEYFEIENRLDNKNENLFPFMYDLPLTPYKKDDIPYCN